MTPPPPRDEPFDRLLIGMLPVDVVDAEACAELIVQLALTRSPVAVRLCNTSSLAEYHSDSEYRKVLDSPGLNLADGTPLVWLSYLAGRRHVRKVRGPTLMMDVIDAGQRAGLRHALVGTTPQILDLLEQRITRDFPSALISAKCAPRFSPDPEVLVASITEALAEDEFDLVWLGLGSPKQDFVSYRLTDRVQAPCLGVGAAFAFAAGTTPEAPPALRVIGMEWLFRLAHEPRRLWRRYAKALAYLVLAITRHGVKQQ